MDRTENCTHVFIKDAFPNELFIIHTTFMVIIFFGIITSNVSMIFGLLKVNNHLTLSKKLFICLSCSDLITGLCTLPVQTAASYLREDAECGLISAQAFFNAFPTSLSLFFLLHISFARYCTVKHANSKLATMQKRFWKHFVLFEILVSFANGFWYSLEASQTEDRFHHASFILFCSFFVVLILTMILILNGRLWNTLTTHRNFTIHNHINEERIVKSHRKAVKTIIILSVILVICYMPTVFSFSVTAGFLFAKDPRSEFYYYLIPWSYIFLLLNSGINSFVIVVRDRKLRAFLKTICLKLEMRTTDPMSYNSEMPYTGIHPVLNYLPSFISSSLRMTRKSHKFSSTSNCNSPASFHLSPDRYQNRLSQISTDLQRPVSQISTNSLQPPRPHSLSPRNTLERLSQAYNMSAPVTSQETERKDSLTVRLMSQASDMSTPPIVSVGVETKNILERFDHDSGTTVIPKERTI